MLRVKILLLFSLFLFSHPLLADRISSALKKLAQEDFEKCAELLEKELEKSPQSASAQHIYAQYFFHPKNPAYHIDSAYARVKLALDLYPQQEEKDLEKWVELKLTPDFAKELKSEIEKKAFENTSALNTPEAYLEFTRKFPEAAQISKAQSKRYALAWQATQRNNNRAAYQAFIRLYPQAPQIPKALKIRDQLIFQEETKRGTLAAYESFLRQNPQNFYRDDAIEAIFRIRSLRHEKEFYQAFIQTYPLSTASEWAYQWLLSFYDAEHNLQEFAQKYPDYVRKNKLEELIRLNQSQLVPVLENDLWGYYDEEGLSQIECQFEFIPGEYLCESIDQDFIIINRNGILGLLNKQGQEILAPRYDKIQLLSPGLFKITRNAFSGLVHQSAREILPPQYESIEVLNPYFLKIRQNRLWGLCSYNGEIVVPPSFRSIEAEGEDFIIFQKQNRMTLASNQALMNQKAQNDIRLEDLYQEVEVLDHEYIQVKENNQVGIKNQEGNFVIPLAMDQIISIPQKAWLTRSANIWRAYRLEGQRIGEYNFESIDFGGNYVGGKMNGKWGVIDFEGKIIRDFEYDSLAFVDETVFLYQGRKVWGDFLKNLDSSPVDFTFFRDMREEKGNYPGAETFIYYEDRSGNKGLFDQKGKKVLSPKYKSIYCLDNDLVNVERFGRYGLVDSNRILVLPIRYDGISNLETSPNYKILLLNRRFGLYNKVKGVKIEPVYDSQPVLFTQKDSLDYFKVSKNGQSGLVNERNEIIVPLKYNEIRPWGENQFLVQIEGGDWTFYNFNEGDNPENLLFEDIQIINIEGSSPMIMARQNGFWGVWQSRKGMIIPPQYDLIHNRGGLNRPLFFAEKRLANTKVEVSYLNLEGFQIWQAVLDRDDYYKFLCEN